MDLENKLTETIDLIVTRRYRLTRSCLEVLASYHSCVHAASLLFMQDEMHVNEVQLV